MGEIIAADPDALKNPALDHYVGRVNAMENSYRGRITEIGDPLRHKARGEIDRSATKLVENTGASVDGVLAAVRALITKDHSSVKEMADGFAASEEDRVNLAGGSGSSGNSSK
ncbi:hypothetical protein ACFY36_01345 [Actinoplanes sp. NPDC000266]